MVSYVLFTTLLVVQSSLSQCVGRNIGSIRGDWPDYFWNNRGTSGLAAAGVLGASNGGSLSVISKSANAPTGISVTSENVYEGNVAVNGNLPFLGTAAVDGAFQSVGSGGINYGCGDGAVGIIDEIPVAANVGVASPIAGIGFGVNANSCGCGI